MLTITKIEPQKNKYDRVNIFVDDEYFCAMQNFICVKNGLKVGAQVEKEKLVSLVYESDKEKALNKTANYLSRGVKTEKQVIDYLAKNGFDNLISEYVLGKLKEYNYINDENYVQQYINTYSKKYGKKKMEFELRNKGISNAIITASLSDFKADDEVIYELAVKYLKNKEIDYKNLQKLSQYLAAKGFTWEEIQKTTNKLKNNKDELNDELYEE